MKNSIFEELVNIGDLKSYNYETVEDKDDLPGLRETERLELIFPSGSKLVLDTFCSGSGQNTCFEISK